MALSSDIIQIESLSPSDICLSIAERVKSRRLELNVTQEGLSLRAGVNIETYRKFERKGEISLLNLVKIASALDMCADFESLFVQKQYQSLDEILATTKKVRKRGKKK